MGKYKYYEVQCPCCKHIFTWLKEPSGNSYYLYRRKGVEEELFSTVCPKCNLEMVIPDGLSVGIEIQNEIIEQFDTIRGI